MKIEKLHWIGWGIEIDETLWYNIPTKRSTI